MDDGVHISSAGTILVAEKDLRTGQWLCHAHVEGVVIGDGAR